MAVASEGLGDPRVLFMFRSFLSDMGTLAGVPVFREIGGAYGLLELPETVRRMRSRM